MRTAGLYVFILLGLYLFLYFIGRVIMLCFFEEFDKKHLSLSRSISIIVALQVMALELYIYYLFPLPANIITLLLPVFIISGFNYREVLVGLQKEYIDFYRWLRTSSLKTKVTILIIALVILFLLLYSITSPFVAWDAFAMWWFKAKVFYQEGRFIFPDTFIGSNAGIFSWPESIIRHYNYPPLYSLTTDIYYILAGRASETITKSINLAYIGSFMLFVYNYFQSKKKVNIIVLIFFITIPSVTAMLLGPNFFGYPDIVLGVILAITGTLFIMYVRESSISNLALLLLFITCLLLTKNEGLPMAAFFIAAICYFNIFIKKEYKLIRYTYILVPLVILLIWLYVTKKNGIHSEFDPSIVFKTTFTQKIDRIQRILTGLKPFFFSDYTTISFGILFLLVIINAWLARSKTTIFICSFIVFTIVIYLGIYFITPYDIVWHIKLSFERLIMQLFPALIVAGSFVARDVVKKE